MPPHSAVAESSAMCQVGGSTDSPNNSERQHTAKSAHGGGQRSGSKPPDSSAARNPQTMKFRIVPGGEFGGSAVRLRRVAVLQVA
jgi:hypothetical protein